VLGESGERSPRVGRRIPPGVVDVERRAVVDQPRRPVPDEDVRVLRRAVRVCHQPVEPDDVGCQLGRRERPDRRVEGERPGQEVERDVRPGGARDQLLDLRIRLGAGEGGVQLDQHDLRDRQAQQPGDLARHELRDQRPGALAGGPELQDVQAVVVGLDEGRQRAALAQGRDVAGRRDGPDHGRSVRTPVGRLCPGATPLCRLQGARKSSVSSGAGE
jgi:hypothetical protein